MKLRLLLIGMAAMASLHLTAPDADASVGGLAKLACPSSAAADHPCRAVYHLGIDGRRHAFPNSDVYFSWHADFSGVRTVSSAELAAWPLGRNVTYRPGSRLVKLVSVPTVYAVDRFGTLRAIPSEAAAEELSGPDWAKAVSDIPDVFFLDYAVGASTNSASPFSSAAALASSPDINAELGTRYEHVTVDTGAAKLEAHVVTLSRSKFKAQTVTGAENDCLSGCDAKPLADYLAEAGALVGIHGSYFCPPDYSGCAGKEYSFRWPAFDSRKHAAVNESELKYHEGPLMAQTADGSLHLWRDARVFTSLSEVNSATGSTVTAALANYPTLLVDGIRVVESEPRLDDGQRTVRGYRGGFGWNDNDILVVVTPSATVIELTDVMAKLGATDAMNLDGGGSTALMYDGSYLLGPGRRLPNALLFLPRQ